MANSNVRAPRTAIRVAVLCSDERMAIAAMGSRQAASVVTADLIVAILWPMLLSSDMRVNTCAEVSVGLLVVTERSPRFSASTVKSLCRKHNNHRKGTAINLHALCRKSHNGSRYLACNGYKIRR
jgi:hypothetical protein